MVKEEYPSREDMVERRDSKVMGLDMVQECLLSRATVAVATPLLTASNRRKRVSMPSRVRRE